MIMPDYQPIPVSVARKIAGQFAKSQVVILAYDPVHKVTQTTTFGVEPFDKENAAAVGKLCTEAIGCDLGKRQTFEDYHQDYSAANYKRALTLLRDANTVLNAHAVGLATQKVIDQFLDSVNIPIILADESHNPS